MGRVTHPAQQTGLATATPTTTWSLSQLFTFSRGPLEDVHSQIWLQVIVWLVIACRFGFSCRAVFSAKSTSIYKPVTTAKRAILCAIKDKKMAMLRQFINGQIVRLKT